MATCLDTPTQIADFASKDTQRLVGTIAKTLAANSPYINLLNGGVFPSGTSDEIRGVVQLQAAPGDSLAMPTFDKDTDMCGVQMNSGTTQEAVATQEYVIRLGTKRGMGPRVCVKNGYSAFKESYTRAEDSLAKLITQYINADIRAQLYLHGASKFTCHDTYSFDGMFTGGTEADVGIKFIDKLVPNVPLSFATVHKTARYLKEVLFAENFGGGNTNQPMHCRFIGSNDIIERFRREAGVKDVLVALTTGAYDLGKTALTSYSWDVTPGFRGIGFATDQRPLRATGFNSDGTLALVNPVAVVTGSNGKAHAVANSSWLSAPYEVASLVFANTFERWVPERYVGEGSFKFAPQLVAGELQWHYVMDNSCNTWGDFGWHKYQITRAYRPIRPQHVVHFLYSRCEDDLGLTACGVTAGTAYTTAESNIGTSGQYPYPIT
jgi:hypothetical protein